MPFLLSESSISFYSGVVFPLKVAVAKPWSVEVNFWSIPDCGGMVSNMEQGVLYGGVLLGAYAVHYGADSESFELLKCSQMRSPNDWPPPMTDD